MLSVQCRHFIQCVSLRAAYIRDRTTEGRGPRTNWHIRLNWDRSRIYHDNGTIKALLSYFYEKHWRLTKTTIRWQLKFLLSKKSSQSGTHMMSRRLTGILHILKNRYGDVIMSAMASQITSLTIVYSTVYSGAVQRKYQSSASLAFVWGIHRWLVNSPHKGPVMRNCFHLMTSSCTVELHASDDVAIWSDCLLNNFFHAINKENI